MALCGGRKRSEYVAQHHRQRFPLRASLAYLGKVKNLDCVGYNKELAGLPAMPKSTQRLLSKLVLRWFPQVEDRRRCFCRSDDRGETFKEMFLLNRLVLACISSSVVIINYYSKEYPFIVGGVIKEFRQA